MLPDKEEMADPGKNGTQTDEHVNMDNSNTHYSQNGAKTLVSSEEEAYNAFQNSHVADQPSELRHSGGGGSAKNSERSFSTKLASSDVGLAPDGGWGWVIAFCSHMTHLLTVGGIFSLSVMYVDWLDEFEAGRSLTSWVISVSIAMTYGIGPLPAYLASKFGYKKVVIVGGILASSGYLLAFFSESIYMLIVAIGLITGSGNGFCFLPAVATVATWFDKKRPLAVGIGTAGVGIGSFVCAPIVHWLIQQFGWRGTLMVIAGIELNLCVIGLLLRPVPKMDNAVDFEKENIIDEGHNGNDDLVMETIVGAESKGNGHAIVSLPQERRGKDLELVDNGLSASMEHLKPDQSDSVAYRQFSSTGELRARINIQGNTEKQPALSAKDILVSGSMDSILLINNHAVNPSGSKRSLHSNHFPHKSQKHSSKPLLEDSVDQEQTQNGVVEYENESYEEIQRSKWLLFRDPVFMIFLVSNIFTKLAFLTPVLFMVDRARFYGIAQVSAAMLVSINGAGNVFGRIVLPTASDWCFSDRLVSYIVCMSACGVATALSVFCGSNFILHAVYAVVFGTTIGMYTTQVALVTVDLVGVDMVGHAYGFMLMFMGMASLVGPPFAGWIFDVTGTYTTAYFINGLFLLASSLMLVPVAIWRRRLGKKS